MQAAISQRVEQIRQWLADNQLDALLIPHEDEFLGEYIPDHNERLHWLTGFTGSAGAAIITRDDAAVFVDGRYVVQVRKQVPADVFQYCHLIEQPPVQWALENLAAGSKVAIDARLHSAAWLNNATTAIDGEFALVSVAENPIDQLWLDRPAPVLSDAQLMGLEFVGQSSTDKRQQIAALLTTQKANAAFLSQLDSIAWLLNIRGDDVHCLPVLLSAAIIHNDASVDFYIDHHRLPAGFAAHVGDGVNICEPEQLAAGLASLAGKRVLFDSANSNAWAAQQLKNSGAQLIEAANPTLLPKATKNVTEMAGMKACHIRDGVAISKFLAWVDAQVAAGNLLDEAELSDQLWQFRQLDPTCRDVSFDTISAAAGNAAMCHYNHIDQPQPSKLQMDTVYLVDSGGQYPDGTTDITRTIAIGTPGDEVKQAFTLVLKGHIALASARFPKGTTGSQLDALARQHLWAHGFDYDHGTGHGVGHFLSVHEGPQRIAKGYNPTALLPGMVLSNEPGYYRADAFGIRIENLEAVVEVATQGDMSVMGFESLTRAPIDKRLIDASLLTDVELAWLNNYHRTVFDVISPALTGADLAWLTQATATLNR
ncbi:X-Pro aminopeptidase [Photobacterium kishitanii]|uniref:Aminopeptidase P family protein n=1 Tax=Photobacterium kishitanii TaxID=318456 RepID=A0AAX0YUM1_9GAMM|nr:aminopeptidase P family protein [Photobacterium kishitanii]KJG08968.1 X-Pro aminopeptidase [Photobacterium kishitanii]KJG55117.1 X-Pro aminopeptidase [Photobacterium kishitanii]KJG57213.1 X-Pro aminopeptidase [Photobacterium kishitanii]KJG63473.1 X-Pro aminopeptidase [Photobacterium kishitanii]KJG65809.1 X-Pro aminopeptidase [Photobacterium kishitanii]